MPIPPFGIQDNNPAIPASAATMESFLQYIAGYTLNPPIPTTVKTAAYTANGQEWVKANTTGGSFPITLPLTQADKTVVAVQLVAGSNPLTVATQSTDTIDVAGGVGSMTVGEVDETVVLVYRNSTSKWSVLAHSGATRAVVNRAIGVAAAL